MEKKFPVIAFLSIFCLSTLCLSTLLFSCAGQKKANSFPVPNLDILKEKNITINVDDIIETKNGSARSIPAWLSSFLNGGIEAVERMDAYSNKYVFIAFNEGDNVAALKKWVEYYTVMQDFPMLVAARIEKRMYLTTTLYPDDEYGAFYEAMMHNAYNDVYPDAVKEDNYWIKTKSQNVEGEMRPSASEIYKYFVLVTIEKNLLQTIIRDMIAKTEAVVKLTKSQNNSVTRLRNNFFEGF